MSTAGRLLPIGAGAANPACELGMIVGGAVTFVGAPCKTGNTGGGGGGGVAGGGAGAAGVTGGGVAGGAACAHTNPGADAASAATRILKLSLSMASIHPSQA